ncbi:hypothetical protein COO60DRAFT_187177 [Scenedesmus sp. NREL 46B-D3]|nr:hypothetical protein COO60DRAFT_187177 [Scenedesmus sp. NREL 46B-D3]
MLGSLASSRSSVLLAAPTMPARAGRTFVAAVECKQLSRKESTRKRHLRIRKKLNGTPDRPRLAVHKSNQHIYAQVIDDAAGRTLVAASTLTADVKGSVEGNGANITAAEAVGKKVAELCAEHQISKVCFDRGGFTYHGRIQALADAAREAGLQF